MLLLRHRTEERTVDQLINVRPRSIRTAVIAPLAVLFGLFSLSTIVLRAGPAGAPVAPLTGTVKDTNGAAVANAFVEQIGTGVAPVLTNSQGEYTIPAPATGTRPFEARGTCLTPVTKNIDAGTT